MVFFLRDRRLIQQARWSSGNAFVSGARGLRFKFQDRQIGHGIVNGLPSLPHSSKEAVLPAGAMTRRWAPPTRYTPRCKTASIMKDLISRLIQFATYVYHFLKYTVIQYMKNLLEATTNEAAGTPIAIA